MKQVPIKLGPLALLLAVISICLTTLAILTFTTARADLRLAAGAGVPADAERDGPCGLRPHGLGAGSGRRVLDRV